MKCSTLISFFEERTDEFLLHFMGCPITGFYRVSIGFVQTPCRVEASVFHGYGLLVRLDFW